MKPILFNTEMVQAILEDRKTVTRRVIKPQPPSNCAITKFTRCFGWSLFESSPEKRLMKMPCEPGDILYVRETWAELDTVYGKPYYAFKADDETLHHSSGENFTHWRPSIHMPKEAARLFLRVKSVRVERLKDISAESAMDEGFTDWNEFVRVWNSTVPKHPSKFKSYPYYWKDNPWVWVIEFERCEKPKSLG